MKKEAVVEARKLLKSTNYGVMSTISVQVSGYPFGSHMPFCMDDDGSLLVYISTLAQHTKNLDANPKCSLTIISPNYTHIQNSQRLTYIGEGFKVLEEEFEKAYETYVRFFPKAARYKEMHDFHIYRINPVSIRYIGGFGKIFWIEVDELFEPSIFTGNTKKSILEHMNEDHKEFMQRYFSKFGLPVPDMEKIRMVDIDKYGVMIMENDKPFFFEFEEPLTDEGQAKDAIIKLGKS
ncbi:MAG: DUF2470 domain-containing protein [Methanobacteriota archaeon]|nr:MAG: DUF2470 domain-containing protein [Euryarchaeota archaeon]